MRLLPQQVITVIISLLIPTTKRRQIQQTRLSCCIQKKWINLLSFFEWMLNSRTLNEPNRFSETTRRWSEPAVLSRARVWSLTRARRVFNWANLTGDTREACSEVDFSTGQSTALWPVVAGGGRGWERGPVCTVNQNPAFRVTCLTCVVTKFFANQLSFSGKDKSELFWRTEELRVNGSEIQEQPAVCLLPPPSLNFCRNCLEGCGRFYNPD